MGTETSHLVEQTAGDATPPTRASRRRAGAWLLLTTMGAVVGLLSLQARPPALVWNFTESVPVGLYSLSHAAPATGDVIAIAPAGAAREALDAYAALPAGKLLLKQLAAVEGDVVCRTGATVTVNGVIAAIAKPATADGRALPAWSGCRALGPGKVLVLTRHAGSFDSRYFGPIGADQIIGIAHPLVTLPASQERS